MCSYKTKMEEVDILKCMAYFDFSKPISVEIVIEDCDDEFSNRNMVEGQDCNNAYDSFDGNIARTNLQESIRTATCNTYSPSQDSPMIEQTVINNNNKPQEGLIQTNPALQVTNSPTSIRNLHEHREINVNQNKTDTCIENSIADVFKRYILTNDRKGGIMYVINLLHRVSAYLILVMRSYYNNSFKNKNELKKHKNQIYNISYNAIESIILPHENNEKFVNKFIDMTVQNANNVFGWNCERKHVIPFYDDMIAWSKQKRDLLKQTNIENSKDKNRRSENLINSNTKNNNNINKNRIINHSNQYRRYSNNEINKDRIHASGIINNRINNEKENKRRSTNNSIISQEENMLFKNYCGNRNKIDNFRISCDGSNSRTENQIQLNRINKDLMDANKLNNYRKCNNTISNNIVHNGVNDDKTSNNSTNDVNCNQLRDKSMKNNKEMEKYRHIDIDTINYNRILMKHLNTAPRPVNFSHSTVAPIPSLNLNTENSTCIFSCGPPGQEITINIGNDTLVSHTSKQNYNQNEKNPKNSTEINGNNSIHPSIYHSNENQATSANNYDLGGNNNKVHTSVPIPTAPKAPPQSLPSYSGSQAITSQTIPERLACNQNSMPSRHLENIRLMVNDDSFFGNTSIPQVQEQSTTACVNSDQVTRVTPFNENNRHVLTGSCYYCQKTTHIKCTKCLKISYCSKQCQWMDTEVRRINNNKQVQLIHRP